MSRFTPCLVVFVLALCFSSCTPAFQIPAQVTPREDREGCDPEQLRQDLAYYEEKAGTSPGERANCLIRLARLSFILGELSPKGEKTAYFTKGKQYAETLIREQPDWTEGHYWLGLNLCGLAEEAGPKRGLRLVPQIIAAMERALEVDPVYDQAGAHRVLGRVYYECPAWPLSVGDLHKSLRHLSAATAIAPENSTNHLFLAETLLKLGKKTDARQELEKVLKATRHALCPKELEEDRRQALRLLKENHWTVAADLLESAGHESKPPPPDTWKQ